MSVKLCTKVSELEMSKYNHQCKKNAVNGIFKSKVKRIKRVLMVMVTIEKRSSKGKSQKVAGQLMMKTKEKKLVALSCMAKSCR